nr:Phenoxybenzoate dioxygenase subunit beta [Candidatus Pantoea persica]
MSQRLHKTAFPFSKARKYLEPGPVLLLSSQFEEEHYIMTLGLAHRAGVFALAGRLHDFQHEPHPCADPQQRPV